MGAIYDWVSFDGFRPFREMKKPFGDGPVIASDCFGKILHIPIGFASVFPLPDIRTVPNNNIDIRDLTAAPIGGSTGQFDDGGF
jgi:hypothetical protein